MGSRGIFLLDSAIASPPGLNGGCLTLAFAWVICQPDRHPFSASIAPACRPGIAAKQRGLVQDCVLCCALCWQWVAGSFSGKSVSSVSQSVILRVLRCFRSLDPASSHGQSSDHAARDPDRCRSDSQGHHTGATHPSLTSIYNRNSGPRCSGEVLKGHHEGTS